jgi:two-component SAPR family response regulator
VQNAARTLSSRNYEQFVVQCAAIAIWLTWGYAIFSFAQVLWQLRSGEPLPLRSGGVRRLITVCVVASWSLLIASRASAASESKPTIELFVDEARQANPVTVLPLALPTSVVAVAGVLQLVQRRREGIERRAEPHAHVQPLSMIAKTTLTELQLAASSNQADGIRGAMRHILLSEPSPVLAAWRPSSTPRTLVGSSDNRVCRTPYFCVPIGVSDGEVIMLSLGASQTFFIEGDHQYTHVVLAHLVNSIALESLGSTTKVFALGFKTAALVRVPTLVVVDNSQQLFEAVRLHQSGDSVVVCSADPLDRQVVDQLRNRGCSVVAACEIDAVDSGCTAAIAQSPKGWAVSSTLQLISMFGLTAQEGAAINRLVSEVSRPAVVKKAVESTAPPANWQILTRVLGPVEVTARDGAVIRFEKSKSIELLAWLTTHRARPTRSAARTALWEVNVQDATFTNVVSDARRSLGRAVPLVGDGEWLSRTLTDSLPLHNAVTTDGELLESAINSADTQDDGASLASLHEALGLVRDLPFSGANYLWPDAEGITTRLTLIVMTAAVMAAELYLERGDTDGVFWSTGQGLKVLPGHEELLALRMRAHALKGDLAAVRAEWSSHQRAVARDVWSGGATSPKLDDLCRDLLQPRDRSHSVSE